ncbi:phage tail tape measure protein [Paenibacillus sp. 3LSP]|uniref:phage tail tape measure protein n=1 Tax=Paenibacillus sp. 3LSP TaxID=2800795 RepID=UPI0028FD88D5|nr:phage tail tape measure protein [Paenibacillus sp. 3LSP]MDU0332538.1 phage tail tape measure protein [Paenibacillus sp. 3LSP]
MAGKKQYEMSFELNGEIDPRISKAFDTLSREVVDLKDDLGQLRKAKTFDKLTREAGEAEGAFTGLRERAKEFGEIFDKTLQFTGAHKIITTVGDMFSNMVSEVGSLDDSIHQMGAATGATAEEMAEFKDIIQEIYEGNFGEGFSDIGNALVSVRRITGESGDALEQTTKNALILRDTFGYEVSESVRSADMLMRQFGLTSEQAYNLIAQGSQKGLDKSGELLDTINEFSPQFSVLGFTANEMFDFFSAGLEAGAWNLDKVGDLVKEFDNRLKDAGDTANREALAQLFAPEDFEKYVSALMTGSTKTAEYLELVAKTSKETAKQLVADLRKGGNKGATAMTALQGILGDSNKMLVELSNGSIKGADAFQLVLAKLAAIEDPIERQTLGIAIMGTQYEDLGQKVVNSLATVDNQFDKTANTMQQIEEIKYSSVTKNLQELGRELMNEVIIPIGEDLMPVLQDMTAWAKDNKDLIKTLALAVPAGMLAKNTVSMGKDFAKVGKSLLGTAGNVGKFGGAVGLLTNPIGLAFGAIGALSLGVIAYKKHQEAARQELINMGDALDKAYDDYSAIDEQTQRTKDLIKEYDRLTEKIKNSNTPAEELTEARRKLANVEKELIDLNPDILRAEDAKSASFRDQLDLAEQLNESRSEMARRELEMSVIEGEKNLPDLEKEYERLNKKLAETNDSYLKAKDSYVQFSEYWNQQQAIVNNNSLSFEEMNAQLDELAKKIYDDTGLDFIGKTALIYDHAQEAWKEMHSSSESWRKTQEEIKNAEDSFQALYDNQKKLIELDLGSTIENQATKYKELSEVEKRRFDAALQDLTELNREMDMIPDAKKVNLELVWQQTGAIPDFSTPAGKKLKQIQLRDPGFNGYADGARITSPELAWVGEGGDDEFIIPVNNSRRSHALYAAAGEALGYNPGGTFAPVYKPQIIIQGSANEQMVRTVMRDSQREWEQNMEAWQRQQQRRNLA